VLEAVKKAWPVIWSSRLFTKPVINFVAKALSALGSLVISKK
jgi:hypothetical protein